MRILIKKSFVYAGSAYLAGQHEINGELGAQIVRLGLAVEVNEDSAAPVVKRGKKEVEYAKTDSLGS